MVMVSRIRYGRRGTKVWKNVYWPPKIGFYCRTTCRGNVSLLFASWNHYLLLQHYLSGSRPSLLPNRRGASANMMNTLPYEVAYVQFLIDFAPLSLPLLILTFQCLPLSLFSLAVGWPLASRNTLSRLLEMLLPPCCCCIIWYRYIIWELVQLNTIILAKVFGESRITQGDG